MTTIRTTGTFELDADLSLKRLVDAGEEPGPHIFVTGPYLEGPGDSPSRCGRCAARTKRARSSTTRSALS